MRIFSVLLILISFAETSHALKVNSHRLKKELTNRIQLIDEALYEVEQGKKINSPTRDFWIKWMAPTRLFSSQFFSATIQPEVEMHWRRKN